MSTDQRTDHGQFAEAPRSEATEGPNSAVGMQAAAAALIMIGVFHLLQGAAALLEGDMFVVGDSWMVHLNVTTWGWIHLALGVLVAAGGFFLLTLRPAARYVAVALLAVCALANLIWMPYYPVLSGLVIVIDGYLIWALTVHREVIPVDENADWD